MAGRRLTPYQSDDHPHNANQWKERRELENGRRINRELAVESNEKHWPLLLILTSPTPSNILDTDSVP